MDFIVKLFKFKDFVNNISYNNIFVIVKHFTKYNKFIPTNEFHSIKDLVDIVIWEVINNYGLLDKFIINRGTTFALRFFIIFIIRLEVNNKLFIIFYL